MKFRGREVVLGQPNDEAQDEKKRPREAKPSDARLPAFKFPLTYSNILLSVINVGLQEHRKLRCMRSLNDPSS